MRALRTVTMLIALAGASTARAEDKQAEETPLTAFETEKLLAFFGDLVDHAVKHASACPALAAAVDGVVVRHGETIKMSWAAKKAKKTLPKDAQAKLDQRALEMVGALRQCWDHDGVKAAFKRMKPPKDDK